jgi:hypothetical protein
MEYHPCIMVCAELNSILGLSNDELNSILGLSNRE